MSGYAVPPSGSPDAGAGSSAATLQAGRDGPANVAFACDGGPGGASTVSVNLKPGKYEFYCPVDSHKQGGMKGTLTVT